MLPCVCDIGLYLRTAVWRVHHLTLHHRCGRGVPASLVLAAGTLHCSVTRSDAGGGVDCRSAIRPLDDIPVSRTRRVCAMLLNWSGHICAVFLELRNNLRRCCCLRGVWKLGQVARCKPYGHRIRSQRPNREEPERRFRFVREWHRGGFCGLCSFCTRPVCGPTPDVPQVCLARSKPTHISSM